MWTFLMTGWLSLWSAGAQAVLPAAAAAPGLPPVGREATLVALHRCFVQQIRHHHRAQPQPQEPNGEPFDPAPLGPSAELFFFDQLASAEKELRGAARLLWCRPWFSGPYLRAHGVLSHRSRVARAAVHPDATCGPRHHFNHHNDATRVLRASAHTGGQHPLAYQARAVLEALGEHGGGPTELDADWLAVTTLVPALYLYDAPHAHAFTPATGAPPRRTEVERARLDFVQHVRHSVRRAQQAEREQKHATALVYLGIAAHALLDLGTHRGMTEAEHAALTYNRQRHPDLLAPPEAQQQGQRALRTLFAQVWPPGGVAQVGWQEGVPKAPRSRALARLVATDFRFGRDTDFATLLQRWRKAYGYAPAGQDAGDDEVLAAAMNGRWDVPATLEAIWRQDPQAG